MAEIPKRRISRQHRRRFVGARSSRDRADHYGALPAVRLFGVNHGTIRAWRRPWRAARDRWPRAADPRGHLWMLRTGAPSRDLPQRDGSWCTVSSRFRPWHRGGQGLLDRVPRAIDDTSVGAHEVADSET